jgi:hypothetical protein
MELEGHNHLSGCDLEPTTRTLIVFYWASKQLRCSWCLGPFTQIAITFFSGSVHPIFKYIYMGEG